MKALAKIIIFLISFSTLNAQWFSQSPLPTIKALNGVYFVNENTGFTVGEGGIILKTTNGGTTIGINQTNEEIPDEFSLYQNYPNPFNQSTMFKFQCSIAGNVKVKIYDISGKEVDLLVNENLQAGTYQVRFNAGDLPSGIYFYSLIVDDIFISTKKFVLIK